MRRLVAFLPLAVASTVLALAAPSADAAGATIEPPSITLSGNLWSVTTRSSETLRVEPGLADVPDGQAGDQVTYDVQVLRTDMRTAHQPAWEDWKTGTTRRWHSLATHSGEIVCFRVREHGWGATSGWSSKDCVLRALGDEDMRRVGAPSTVKDHRYSDGRATVLRSGDSLRLRHVPKDTWYGPVSTQLPPRKDGTLRCFGPAWRIIGHGVPNSAEGVSRTTLRYLTYHRNPGGTATVYDGDGSCPVGGFVVLPKWMR